MGMARLLPWPNLYGAADSNGWIVIGSKRSRAKDCRTRLVFMSPACREERVVLATRVAWAKDNATAAILVNGLRDLLNRKLRRMPGRSTFDRGGAACQVSNCRVMMYEAGYRGALWPRYWWWLPYSDTFQNSIAMAILMETHCPDTIVAEEDTRPVAAVESMPLVNYGDRPRFYDGWQDYIDQIITKRVEGGQLTV